MFTLVLLLVVLASMRGSFRAVWLPPGLDAYWYAYQETGDLQIETREFAIDALILLHIVRIDATNKFGMVLVKEVDVIPIFELWMK